MESSYRQEERTKHRALGVFLVVAAWKAGADCVVSTLAPPTKPRRSPVLKAPLLCVSLLPLHGLSSCVIRFKKCDVTSKVLQHLNEVAIFGALPVSLLPSLQRDSVRPRDEVDCMELL